MPKSRYRLVSQELKNNYGVDVLHDVLLGRPDRTYLYAVKAPIETMNMTVISGSLTLFGFEDRDRIAMSDILRNLDLDNRYADVSGKKAYRDYVENELSRKEGEPNVTFPIQNNGKRYWLHIMMSPVYRHDDLFSVFMTNVTQTMISEEQNFDRSHRDALTGLFNKYTLDYHYGLRYKLPEFHAMYLDLDDFKSVNDLHGHREGDQFLQLFSEILKSHQSDYSLFYRLGGDEFIGLLFQTADHVKQIAEDILSRTRMIRIPGVEKSPSVSIGIVRSEQGEDVIRKADHVMYDVKRSGKNHYSYLSESEFDQRNI